MYTIAWVGHSFHSKLLPFIAPKIYSRNYRVEILCNTKVSVMIADLKVAAANLHNDCKRDPYLEILYC